MPLETEGDEFAIQELINLGKIELDNLNEKKDGGSKNLKQTNQITNDFIGFLFDNDEEEDINFTVGDSKLKEEDHQLLLQQNIEGLTQKVDPYEFKSETTMYNISNLKCSKEDKEEEKKMRLEIKRENKQLLSKL